MVGNASSIHILICMPILNILEYNGRDQIRVFPLDLVAAGNNEEHREQFHQVIVSVCAVNIGKKKNVGRMNE